MPKSEPKSEPKSGGPSGLPSLDSYLEEPKKKKTEKQQRIDDAALEIFAEKGYAATSTSEIAKKAEVAEGTIFRHYSNKKTLLMAVVKPFIRNVVAPLATRTLRPILETEHVSLEAFLRMLFEDRVEMVAKHQRMLRIVMQEMPFHDELRSLFEQIIRERVVPLFSEQITGLQARGLIDAGYPVATVIRLIVSNFATYLAMRFWFAPHLEWHDERDADDLLRFVSRGLQPRMAAASSQPGPSGDKA